MSTKSVNVGELNRCLFQDRYRERKRKRKRKRNRERRSHSSCALSLRCSSVIDEMEPVDLRLEDLFTCTEPRDSRADDKVRVAGVCGVGVVFAERANDSQMLMTSSVVSFASGGSAGATAGGCVVAVVDVVADVAAPGPNLSSGAGPVRRDAAGVRAAGLGVVGTATL